MTSAKEIENYLLVLSYENKMDEITKDHNLDCDVLLDLKTGNYKGVRFTIEREDDAFEVDTKNNWIVDKNNQNDLIYISKDLKFALEKFILNDFDYDDIDEDEFKNFENNSLKDLSKFHKKESKKIIERILNTLKAIKENDYDKNMVREFIKQFSKTKKVKGYNLKLKTDFYQVKINTKKNTMKFKDSYGFEKRVDIGQEIPDFDFQKLVDYIEKLQKRQDYSQRMMDAEDMAFNEESLVRNLDDSTNDSDLID